MPYRMIVALLLGVALELAAATVARAQSVADADNTMHAMDLRMRALNTARKNLQQSGHYRDDHEADAVREITDADVVVFAAAIKVFTVAFFITRLQCPDDVRFSQKQFVSVVESFVTTADEQLSRVNGKLVNVAAPEAIAEATKSRDVIADLRQFLKPFAGKEPTDVPD